MDSQISELLAESRARERAGKLAEALRWAEQALELARASDDKEGMCGGLEHIAVVHARLGHYDEASRLATEALRFADRIPDSARAYNVLGGCAAETHDFATAEEMFRRCADVSRQIGFQEGLLLASHNLAEDVYIQRGQFQLALEAEQEAYRIGLEIESPINVGLPMNRAYLYQIMGRRDEARAALAELKHLTHWRAQVVYLIIAARLALDEDDLATASELLRNARAVAERVGHPRTDCWLRGTLSRLYRLQDDGATARAWADDALAIARRADYRLMEGESLIVRAEAERALGDLAAAESNLRAALQVLIPLGAAYHVALGTFLLAALYQPAQRAEAEPVWLDAAQQITRGGYEFLLERERALAFPLVTHYARSQNGTVRAATEKLLERLARVPPLPLHIAGLGRFEVRQGNRAIAGRAWEGRKAGELFRYLLLQPQKTASRDVIQEWLWPKHTSSTAQLLFNATSALRRVLEPGLPDKFPSRYLTVEAEQVALYLPPGSTVDFEQFEREMPGAVSGHNAQQLIQIIHLYADDLFPLDRYANWATIHRERLAQLYLRGLLALAQIQLTAGQAHEALDAIRRILAREPWQEEAALVGMRACLTLNNRPGALRLYRDLRDSLRRELDISPRADLTALADSLQQ